MIRLRTYQIDGIVKIREIFSQGFKRVLYVLPTGGGKTILFCWLVRSAVGKGKRVWIITHRGKILRQICKTLSVFSLAFGIIKSGLTKKVSTDAVQVASVLTLVNLIGRLDGPDLIIIDEGHHVTATNAFGKIIAAYASAYVLVVTATPERLGGEGLGVEHGGICQAMVIGPQTAELVEQGYLCPVKVFCPPNNIDFTGLRKVANDWSPSGLEKRIEKSSLFGDAVEEYQKRCTGMRAIAFCLTVKLAMMQAQYFRDAGITAEHIEGTMTEDEQENILGRLEMGETMVLTSCQLVGEGFDLPAVECGILLDPTMSLVKYLQEVGRTRRPSPGKLFSIINDHAGNSLKHGLPDDEHEWTLEGFSAKKRANQEYPIRSCPFCWAVMPVSAAKCTECHKDLPVKQPKIEVKSGALLELERERIRWEKKSARKEQGRAQTLDELIAIGKAKGYAHPSAWAWHVFNSRGKRA